MRAVVEESGADRTRLGPVLSHAAAAVGGSARCRGRPVARTAKRLLYAPGYRLQANLKAPERRWHPARDVRFRRINRSRAQAVSRPLRAPVSS